MPITLMDDFPARSILEKEDIFAINNERAIHQDIRPLHFLILNLMPNKIATETQLLRLISQSPLQIEVDFLKIASHEHKHTSLHHLNKFYLEFEQIKKQNYDALIITGAPVETLPFEEVDYWEELKSILDWSQLHTTSTLYICWGAQAGLFYQYGVEKILYKEKLFGIYPQKIAQQHRLFRGFDDRFNTPQSRYTGINDAQINPNRLQVIASNEEIGPSILVSNDEHDVFLLGHFEYDTDTLDKEYKRDLDRGLKTEIPENYYHYNNPKDPIINCWRAHAFLFYHNWINDVYQMTPFDIAQIPERQKARLQVE